MPTADPDPVLAALDRAPLGEEDLTAEELAELDRRATDLASGHAQGAPHDDVQREIERSLRKAG